MDKKKVGEECRALDLILDPGYHNGMFITVTPSTGVCCCLRDSRRL